MVGVGTSRVLIGESLPQRKALLIDFDGVLRQWPATDAALELAHGLPDGALRRTAFERELLNDVVTGRISDEIWRRQLETLLGRQYPQARVSDAVAAWSRPVGEIDRNVLQLVQRARERIKIVLVTNGTSRLNRDLDALGMRGSLDIVVNSSDIGVAKPALGFYAAALRASGVSAAEALYVDDSRSNIAAATQLGICAECFTGHEALATLLLRYRLIEK